MLDSGSFETYFYKIQYVVTPLRWAEAPMQVGAEHHPGARDPIPARSGRNFRAAAD